MRRLPDPDMDRDWLAWAKRLFSPLTEIQTKLQGLQRQLDELTSSLSAANNPGLDYETLELVLDGDFTGGETILFERFGDLVCMHLSNDSYAHAAPATSAVTSAGWIPAAWRPAVNFTGPAKQTENRATVASTGQVTFLASSSSDLKSPATVWYRRV